MTKAVIELNYKGKTLFTGAVNSDGYPSNTGKNIVELLKLVKTVKKVKKYIPFFKFCNYFSQVTVFGGEDYTYKIDISEKPIKVQVLGYKGEEEFNGPLKEFETWL